MKRLLSCYASDCHKMSADELKLSIQASAGRTIVGETVVVGEPLIEGVTNAEMMAAFGADLILLNVFDVFEKRIVGMYPCDNPIAEIKKLTGRPLGINLEPVDPTADFIENRLEIGAGRCACQETFVQAQELGVDFICLTGNPATGVSNASIKEAITSAKKYYSGLIFAGKMHAGGLSEKVLDEKQIIEFVRLGADGVLIPAVGTVPGVREEEVANITQGIHELGGLVMSTIGTSQESADSFTIKQIGLSNKRVGVDIHHIGDGGYGKMADPENIMELSITIRGKRHTYFKMAQSAIR